ncbi:MAG: hypothetical protein JWM43_495 [Acidobacteriaceae bacterium]|nr:hypothetical protein [Acidobacteriaceae bacterium]
MSSVTQVGPQTSQENESVQPASTRSKWMLVCVSAFLLLALLWAFAPDGQAHASWQQFLGRFHPLAVHLPIGLLLLVPVLEIGGRFRPSLREAAGFVLVCAAVCSIGAVVLGMLLAHGGGFAKEAVRGHMWAGLILTIAVITCTFLRSSWITGRSSFLYPVVLLAVLALTAWTGHQGGALTYGKTYLTEFAPAFIKQLEPHKTYPPVDPVSVYVTRIQPILDSNCITCHSGAKVKGGLQLDTYAHLMDGGSSGEVIAASHPEKSLLFTRITLPAEHPKFMPSEGKPPLTAKDIAWIRAWVQQGASPSSTTLVGMELKPAHIDDPIPQVGDYSGLTSQIEQIESSLGIKLDRVSAKPADGLVLRTIGVSQKFDDADLAKLEPLAPYIVDAELGHTKVTDNSFATLAKMPHLRAIHLEETSIDGRNIKQLTGLAELRYLNLSSTRVTKQALSDIAPLKTLQHIYSYNTPAAPVPVP